MPKGVVVIGLGNPYMRDDAVGVLVARALQERSLGGSIQIYEHQEADTSLLEYFEGAKKVIIVDALRAGRPPGSLTKYTISDRGDELTHLPGLHALQLHDLVDLARSLKLLSSPVIVIGVEPGDTSLGEGLTPEVAKAIPAALSLVLEEIEGQEVHGA